MRLSWLENAYSRPLFRRAILTRKVGHTDLVFRVRSLSISMCVCLDVNQGGTNRNRCKQRLVIFWIWNIVNKLPIWGITHRPTNEPSSYTKKLCQSDLLYESKSPDEKVGVNRHFQAS